MDFFMCWRVAPQPPCCSRVKCIDNYTYAYVCVYNYTHTHIYIKRILKIQCCKFYKNISPCGYIPRDPTMASEGIHASERTRSLSFINFLAYVGIVSPLLFSLYTLSQQFQLLFLCISSDSELQIYIKFVMLDTPTRVYP